MVEEVRNYSERNAGIWCHQGLVKVLVCNAVVLVRKKDGGLHFCINF